MLARLRTHFGHRRFRQGQEQIVAAVLGGRDVLAVMPTGSGKSLGYQLPAVMLPGTTLVVSPLISLMKDQVDELNRRGIPSGALHSMLSADNRRDVLSAARAGALRLLYVAPERFASDQFLRLLGELDVARFVVDEAHCVSRVGPRFPPRLPPAARGGGALPARAIGASGRPPIAAFTATATAEVRDDIVALLGLEEPQVLVAGFDRPNIYLRVERVDDEDDKNERLPGLVRGRRALVYAATRKTAEAAAASLQARACRRPRITLASKTPSARACRTRLPAARCRSCARPTRSGWASTVRTSTRSSTTRFRDRSRRTTRRSGAPAGTDVRDGDALVGLRRRLHARVPDRQPAARQAGQRRLPLDPEDAARRKELEHRKLRRMIDYADTLGMPASDHSSVFR